MKREWEDRTGATRVSRRRFLSSAGVAGAGALSAGLVKAGTREFAEKARQIVLSEATKDVTPFRVQVPQAALDDLGRRLADTRWPSKETVGDWSQGVPLAKARALAEYWRTRYDWRRAERALNAFPQFRTQIDGLGVHFIHVTSKHGDALPIVLTHGWPGSIVEFLKILGPMTDPTRFGGGAEDAFHVVVPSMPGFGFSDKPAVTGWDVVRTANAWGVLMKRLGYSRWVAQGGDWGSGVTHALGHVRPEGLVAAHVNWPLVFPEKLPERPDAAEKAAMDAAAQFVQSQSGYFTEQATRPQTIGYALSDSPVGVAMWIYEKFQAWTDNHGDAEDALTLDEMLDDISLYWFTNTSASSARIYWENTRGRSASYSAGRIELPMSASIFPREIYRAPRKWAEAMWPNLFYWNELDKGGHFAAFEQPSLFVSEIRRAFASFRK